MKLLPNPSENPVLLLKSLGLLATALLFCVIGNLNESEAIANLKLTLQVQKVYWSEHNQFALSSEQINAVAPPNVLQLNVPKQHYRYILATQPENRRNIENTGITKGLSRRSFTTITATPKIWGGLRSFTGVLIIAEIGNMTQFKTEICRTNLPSQVSPPVSIASAALNTSPQCPPGSQPVL